MDQMLMLNVQLGREDTIIVSGYTKIHGSWTTYGVSDLISAYGQYLQGKGFGGPSGQRQQYD